MRLANEPVTRMEGRPWHPEETEMLRRRYPLESTRAIAQDLRRSYEAVKSRATVLGLTKASRRPWAASEFALMRQRYPHESTSVIATALNRPISQVYQCADRLGLAKTAVYLASPAACRLRRGDNVGKAFRYPKGHVPQNKGLRRPGWHSGRMKETQFKRGELSGRAKALLKPVGSERISKDGYLERKVREFVATPEMTRAEANRKRQRIWRGVHLIVWEETNGPIPAGHAVCFKDGNKRNIAIDNLELVARQDLMRRNTIHNLPPELKETVQLLGRVNRQIRKRERNAEEQNH